MIFLNFSCSCKILLFNDQLWIIKVNPQMLCLILHLQINILKHELLIYTFIDICKEKKNHSFNNSNKASIIIIIFIILFIVQFLFFGIQFSAKLQQPHSLNHGVVHHIILPVFREITNMISPSWVNIL